jgi:hypothetical protein
MKQQKTSTISAIAMFFLAFALLHMSSKLSVTVVTWMAFLLAHILVIDIVYISINPEPLCRRRPKKARKSINT